MVENLFGVWKRRFPCLTKTLRCDLETSCVIIVATAILHNIAVEQGEREFLPGEEPEVVVNLEPPEQPQHERTVVSGIRFRNEIIRRYFTE